MVGVFSWLGRDEWKTGTMLNEWMNGWSDGCIKRWKALSVQRLC